MSAHYTALGLREHDDTSPDISTPTTTSPDNYAISSVPAEQTFTPLSMIDEFPPATEPSADNDKPVSATQATGPALDHGDGGTVSTGTTDPSSLLALSAPPPAHDRAPAPGQGQSQGPSSTHGDNLMASPSNLPAHDAFPEPRQPIPLRTGSVRHDTKIAHPKPINLTTSSAIVSAQEHVNDLNNRLGAHVGNVAQLEATAEQLSRTSSIDHAIRDLHGELKRSDSRRSSVLAATVRASSTDDHSIPAAVALKRGLSNSSSIVPTNIAARHGGYSPAAFVMSPSHSLSGRLRSGSKNSSGRPDIDTDIILGRHGPGKASVRSIRSAKHSLAEISESDPVALDKTAFDRADAASPILPDANVVGAHTSAQTLEQQPNTDAFHKMLGDGAMDFGPPADLGFLDPNPTQRPSTSRSNTTFQEAQDAFIDFDGVHWEPEEEMEAPSQDPPTPRQPIVREQRQSYIDPLSGQQMMWYPAPVPSMLNLPPKLSASRPKPAQHDSRRSQILSTMIQQDQQIEHQRRHSAMPGTNSRSRMPKRDSWLPDPLAGHRESFIGLDAEFQDPAAPIRDEVPLVQDTIQDNPADQLRRPPRLSRQEPEQRHSRMPQAPGLPSQLRASAFFDLPSTVPQIEVKDGSAMATLDSILDAAAVAPASAFTDHTIAGKLGNEVYGKEKKRRSQAAGALLHAPMAPHEPKKRASFMWLGKRSASHHSSDHGKATSNTEDDQDEGNSHLSRSADGDSVIRLREEQDDEDDEDLESEGGYQGPPTTLLAELQLRKQQQKQRTQPLSQAFPNGMHATLLEMDAVAEAQRKERKGRRVNLAWEDPDAHYDQNGSDDEDVPLAIIAAKQQGAKNMADIERPMGLMERREIEENEPLSKRRARLQGLETKSLAQLQQRQSMMNLSAVPRPGGSRAPSRAGLTPEPDLETEEPEIEGESLGERKRRLAAKEEAEGRLPSTRPVSRAFTDELLEKFGPSPEPQEIKSSSTPPVDAGEETLGQRRRRLQAEREARDREMSYSNLVGRTVEKRNSRLSMADVLGAYPKRDTETQPAQRPVMPNTLTSQIVNRNGAFQGGIYNNGTGAVAQGAQSSPATNMHGMNYNPLPGPGFNGYGVPFNQQQPVQFGMASPMGAYNPMMAQYPAPAMSSYGGGMMQPGVPMQMPMPNSGGSMDRVEMWRQSIQP